MLDVERPTGLAAARRLRAAGAIRYSRGRVTVADRGRLERATYVCYLALVEDYARAFSQSVSTEVGRYCPFGQYVLLFINHLVNTLQHLSRWLRRRHARLMVEGLEHNHIRRAYAWSPVPDDCRHDFRGHGL